MFVQACPKLARSPEHDGPIMPAMTGHVSNTRMPNRLVAGNPGQIDRLVFRSIQSSYPSPPTA